MNIILISFPLNIENEHESILLLFENGLKYFHLRKENFSKQNYSDFLNKIPEKFHKNIVISHFQELINDFNLKGIHFSQKEREEKKHFLFEEKHYIKTTSFHSISEINEEKFNWDFYYLSPFFESISKKKYKKKDFNIENLDKKKLIALGGISEKNIYILKNKKIKNFAILGSIWSISTDYLNNFKVITSKL